MWVLGESTIDREQRASILRLPTSGNAWSLRYSISSMQGQTLELEGPVGESSKRACWRRRSPLRRSDPPSRAPRGELHAGFWRGTLLGRAPARGCELRAPPPVQRPRACEGRHGRGGRG